VAVWQYSHVITSNDEQQAMWSLAVPLHALLRLSPLVVNYAVSTPYPGTTWACPGLPAQ